MKLKADVVVMTTPDLQRYYLKRSLVREDVEYIYIDHGMGSINITLRTGALDHYDTIFASGPQQVDEIRKIEKLRNTKKKKIVEVGYPLMDNLINKHNSIIHNFKDKKTILIAPSYQEDNILLSCIDEILDNLIDKNYKIIVRPHPQFIKRNNEKIEELLEKYKSKFNSDFYFELDFSSNETIYTADLLITDWSGICFEYSLSTMKPTLFVNTKLKVINKDYSRIDIEPLDITIRNIIGKTIEKNQIKDIDIIIQQLLLNQEIYKKQILKTRQQHLFNLGESAKIGAEYIIKRIKKGDI